MHKERELPKPSSFSEKKGEKKASLLPSSNFFITIVKYLILEEKEELLHQIKELQDENERYLNLLIKRSKGEKIILPETVTKLMF